MSAQPRWNDDEIEAVRDLAAAYFLKEVVPTVTSTSPRVTPTPSSMSGQPSHALVTDNGAVLTSPRHDTIPAV